MTSRRDFLKFMGGGALTFTMAGGSLQLLQACATGNSRKIGGGFTALSPSREDKLRLADGLSYKVIAAHGDELRPGLRFGYNNDFLAFFPDGPGEGLLCVNHETPSHLFVSGWIDQSVPKTRAQVETEMENTGVSVLHVREKSPGEWAIVPGSGRHRKVTGRTPIPLVSPRPIEGGREALGTLANCAGGVTPWHTYLSCEENYDQFYGEIKHGKNGRRTHTTFEVYEWYKHFPQPPEHYGWVVEIDPRTGSAKKLTALGRFAHEGATVKQAKDGRAVVYMGDDADDQCLFKFIAARPGSLERGTLYAADVGRGRWIPLVRERSPALKKHFRDQTEVLIRAREAAHLLGATPLNRPEDVEICPRTGAVFVALTNNKSRGDSFGSILRIDEENGDHLSLSFRASTFLTGGTGSGLACPDNLAFDHQGNLWVTTDISGASMNKGEYTPFMNNGLYLIPMSGKKAGHAFLVATAPRDAEFTGPAFSPDGRTLFLSVQHPGEESKSLDACTSHWPNGGNSPPKPAVVAISGPLLGTIQGV